MKAPDKIYMTPSYGEPDNVLLASFSKSHLDYHIDIEYIRKDALIEWVKDNLLECEVSNDETDYGRIDVYKKLIDKLNSM